MFEANSGYVRGQLARADVQSPEDLLNELTSELQLQLSDYVRGDRVGNGLALMMGGRPTPTIPEYALYLLRAAAFLSPERVARLLSSWAAGEPLAYKTCLVLSGISVDEPTSISGGIHFRELPKSSDALAKELPLGIGSHIGTMTAAGAVKVEIESREYPVLFKPGVLPDIQTETLGSSRDFLYAEFCEVLSLACDGHVSWMATWRDFGELVVFGSGIHSGFASGPVAWTHAPEYATSPAQLAHAGDLLRQRRNSPNPAVGIAAQRWSSSKQPSESLADRFIDLRIALESLYLSERGPELGFRLATHGAWHLGADAGERRRCFLTLRDAYNAASTAVHKGELEATDERLRLLAEAQDLCRRGILERLGEDTAPDWNALILGMTADSAAANRVEAYP